MGPRLRIAAAVSLALALALAAGAETRADLARLVRAKAGIAEETIERRAPQGAEVDDLVVRAHEIAALGKRGRLEQANRALDQLLILLAERVPGSSGGRLRVGG